MHAYGNRMKALAAVSIAVLSYVLAPNSAWATDNQATRRAVTAITPVRPKSEFLGQTRGGFSVHANQAHERPCLLLAHRDYSLHRNECLLFPL
jgi:hypothetical protein